MDTADGNSVKKAAAGKLADKTAAARLRFASGSRLLTHAAGTLRNGGWKALPGVPPFRGPISGWHWA